MISCLPFKKVALLLAIYTTLFFAKRFVVKTIIIVAFTFTPSFTPSSPYADDCLYHKSRVLLPLLLMLHDVKDLWILAPPSFPYVFLCHKIGHKMAYVGARRDTTIE
jgi:hypothetical protein